MKIMYEELSDVKSSIRSERLNAVGSFNSVTSSIDGLAGNRNLLGGGWVSTVRHLQAYQEIDKALFNVYYEMDNSLNSYLTDFVGEVGKTDEVLDTDDLGGLLRDLQTAQNEYTNLMSDLAKSMKNVPVLGDFFKQQSIDPIKEDIEILQKYQAFESSHASQYSELSSLINDVNTGLAQLGNPANFLNPRDGYRIVDYGNQQWFKNLKGYNDSQPKSRVETVTELDDAGNVVYVVYTNGVKDEKLTAQLTEAMKESWLDRSIDAIAQFLDIVGNVVKTTLGVVTTITGIIGTIGGCAVVTLATGGVGILVDGVIVTEGIIVTTAGVALTVDGINGLTTSNFAGKDSTTNQINKQIDSGKAPKGVKRADKGFSDVEDAQDHIHFDDSRWTLNRDGSWGHNSSGQPPKLTKKILKWLQDIGWKLP
ncbi:T7SS effector LXG polymorphic toxin [Candidatus Enterococcus lemimoniae]|uniref:LXG domain-containing protein n=1 Tax=Candidatus Enterococcus lemimoniae TaxID=1834167 RepID=A0ABZ2T7C7_9ENTE|nr:T7SS effector LXG polymorphic toxin [Enterococcus sp. 12C11_DIV0727]OTO70816.1 hypothetical protein A5866_003054 [Enterococcus sp. 12C11_DIV0727]